MSEAPLPLLHYDSKLTLRNMPFVSFTRLKLRSPDTFLPLPGTHGASETAPTREGPHILNRF